MYDNMGLYSSRDGGEYTQYYGYYEHDDYSTDIMSHQNYHGKHKNKVCYAHSSYTLFKSNLIAMIPLFLHLTGLFSDSVTSETETKVELKLAMCFPVIIILFFFG